MEKTSDPLIFALSLFRKFLKMKQFDRNIRKYF